MLGLSTAVVDCSNGTTLEAFREAVLVDAFDASEQDGYRPVNEPSLDERKIAHVIVAKHLDIADPNVQVQSLEACTLATFQSLSSYLCS